MKQRTIAEAFDFIKVEIDNIKKLNQDLIDQNNELNALSKRIWHAGVEARTFVDRLATIDDPEASEINKETSFNALSMDVFNIHAELKEQLDELNNNISEVDEQIRKANIKVFKYDTILNNFYRDEDEKEEIKKSLEQAQTELSDVTSQKETIVSKLTELKNNVIKIYRQMLEEVKELQAKEEAARKELLNKKQQTNKNLEIQKTNFREKYNIDEILDILKGYQKDLEEECLPEGVEPFEIYIDKFNYTSYNEPTFTVDICFNYNIPDFLDPDDSDYDVDDIGDDLEKEIDKRLSSDIFNPNGYLFDHVTRLEDWIETSDGRVWEVSKEHFYWEGEDYTKEIDVGDDDNCEWRDVLNEDGYVSGFVTLRFTRQPKEED